MHLRTLAVVASIAVAATACGGAGRSASELDSEDPGPGGLEHAEPQDPKRMTCWGMDLDAYALGMRDLTLRCSIEADAQGRTWQNVSCVTRGEGTFDTFASRGEMDIDVQEFDEATETLFVEGVLRGDTTVGGMAAGFELRVSLSEDGDSFEGGGTSGFVAGATFDVIGWRAEPT